MFSNMKIGTRMAVGFALVLLLMMSVTLIGTRSMANLNGQIENIVTVNAQKEYLSNEMNNAVFVISRALRSVVLIKDPVATQAEIKKIEQARQKMTDNFVVLAKMESSPQEDALQAKIKANADVVTPINDKVMALNVAGKDEESLELLLTVADPAVQKYQDSVVDLILFMQQDSKRDYAIAQEVYTSARTLMWSMSVFAILLSVLIAWFLTRGITRPINVAVHVANRLSEGDLSVKIDSTAKDETGQMLEAMRNMVAKLTQVIDGQRLLVSAANKGNFDARIDLNGLQGFQKNMGEDLNQLVTITGASINDVVRVMGAV